MEGAYSLRICGGCGGGGAADDDDDKDDDYDCLGVFGPL